MKQATSIYKYVLAFIAVFFLHNTNAQTFYANAVLDPLPVNPPIWSNTTYQFSVDNCDSVKLYTCEPVNDTNTDYLYDDIAIDTSGNIYYVSSGGNLYTRKLNDSTSCHYLGVFDSSAIVALVADVGGNLLAAGTNNKNIPTLYEYQPKTKTFLTLGSLPVDFFPSGDLFFYEGKLFLTAYNPSNNDAFIVEITISNPSQSCYYMDLGNINPWGAFSIQYATYSDAYIINDVYNGANNTFVSTLCKLDLSAKTVSAPICTYPFTINGTATVYKYIPSIADSFACTSLPVKFLNFAYTLLNKTVNLQWQTTTETNSNYFLIQRSADGTNFSTIGKQPAANNSSTLKQYAFADNDPLSINYYRLKEVDLNGNSTYSNTLLVKLPQQTALQILQNPVQSSLQVQVNSGQPKTSTLTIFDFSGRRLKTLTVTNGLQSIDISALPAGVYILQLITNNGDLYNERFVKGN